MTLQTDPVGGSWWASHAEAAARDRFAAGRALSPVWVAELEAEVIGIVRQGGGDTGAALDGLHEGLTLAARSDGP